MERLVVWGDEAEELLADTEALVAVLRAWRSAVTFSRSVPLRDGPAVVEWALAEFGTLLPLSAGNRDERVARARRLRDLVQGVVARGGGMEALRGDVAGGSSGGETGSQGHGPRGSHDPVGDSAKEEDVVRCAVSLAPHLRTRDCVNPVPVVEDERPWVVCQQVSRPHLQDAYCVAPVPYDRPTEADR